jgi:bifunctional N-acetylglucosamine-1-phosphate-uridyltransferase/glucosamine-1-phosphate-acetyltransferase GlmU-like protein
VTLIRESTIEGLVAFYRKSGYRAAVLTADVPRPAGYGRIVRKNEN